MCHIGIYDIMVVYFFRILRKILFQKQINKIGMSLNGDSCIENILSNCRKYCRSFITFFYSRLIQSLSGINLYKLSLK